MSSSSKKRKNPEEFTDAEEASHSVSETPTSKKEKREMAEAEAEARANAARAAAAAESSSDDEEEDAIDLSVPSKLNKEDLWQVHFEFYDAKEGDFHSIKQQLFHKLPGLCEGGNLSDLTDAIVTQAEVGTLVRVSGTQHVFGFVTALPTALHKNAPFFKAITETLLKRCPKEKSTAFGKAVAAGSTGMLFSQRVLNIPDHLVPKMYENLAQDIAWATKESEAGAAFNMTQFLVLAPFVASVEAGKETRTFVRAEEKYFAQVADVAFEVTLSPKETSASKSNGVAAVSGPNRFCVMVVKLKKLVEAIDDFDSALPPLPGNK